MAEDELGVYEEYVGCVVEVGGFPDYERAGLLPILVNGRDGNQYDVMWDLRGRPEEDRPAVGDLVQFRIYESPPGAFSCHRVVAYARTQLTRV